MLRVAGKKEEPKKEAPVEKKEAPVDQDKKPQEMEPTDDAQPEDVVSEEGLPKLDPECVVYLGAEYGPFRCDNCVYFSAPRSCNLVSGPIEAGGCCNVFVNLGRSKGEADPEEEKSE